MSRCLVFPALLVLAACAATPPPPREVRGDVGVREIDAAAAPSARLTLARNESFQRPLFSSDNALPAYPPALLPQSLPPHAVCLRVGIDETGRVSMTEPVAAGTDCEMTERAAPEFISAAREAAQGWRFDPAFRCVHPEGEPPDYGLCSGEGVREIPQAVSLVYRFVFEQVDGRGAVRLAE